MWQKTSGYAGGVPEPGDAAGHRGRGPGPRHRHPLHPLLQVLHCGNFFLSPYCTVHISILFYSATSWYCKTFLSSHISVTISILLFKCYIVVRPSYLLAYLCHYSWVLTRLHGKKGNEAISGDSEILRGLVHYSTRISSCFSHLLVV